MIPRNGKTLNQREIRIALHEELLAIAPNALGLTEAGSIFRARSVLSVSRSDMQKAVTEAAHSLQKEGTVELSQNSIKLTDRPRMVWLEKSRVEGRPDRVNGPYRVGRALWSPKRDITGGDTYASMRNVRPGDIILHLTDSARISGVSKVASYASANFVGIPGSDWSGGTCYLVDLNEYEACQPPFERADFLGNLAASDELLRIRESHKNLFYDRKLHLMQGFYLTPVPTELAELLNRLYRSHNAKDLPHFQSASMEGFSDPGNAYGENQSARPPEIPEQGIGPRFTLGKGGVVEFDVWTKDGAAPVDLARLQSLHTVLLETAKDLVQEFRKGTNQHVKLAWLAENYLDLVDSDISEIDFARLYGVGLRLQVALEAAQRSIESRLLPELEDPQYEALQSLANLHGVFIQSSTVGQQLLSDAERFSFRREDIPAFKGVLTEMGMELSAQPEIVDQPVGRFFSELAEDVGEGNHPDRTVAYSLAAYSNLTIVLAEIATTSLLASQFGILGSIGGLAGATAFFLTRRRGKDAISVAKRMLTDVENKGDEGIRLLLRSGSTKYTDFILSNEALFRRLASLSSRLQFIVTHIDWLKKFRK
jgi:hypothetical protein